MAAANSNNHGGDGQNVLYADGHVDWSPTVYCGSPRPISGAPRDNIYTAASPMTSDPAQNKGSGVEATNNPLDQYDSVMLPSDD